MHYFSIKFSNNRQALGASPPPAPLNLRFWWPGRNVAKFSFF